MPSTRLPRIVVSAILALGSISWAAGAQAQSGVPVTICGVSYVAADTADEESVLGFLRTYESTLASGRAERIVSLYSGARAPQYGELQDYFATMVRDLSVRLDDIHIVVEEDDAEVSFDRTDAFTDRKSGSPVERSVRIDRRLERHGGTWRIRLDGRS